MTPVLLLLLLLLRRRSEMLISSSPNCLSPPSSRSRHLNNSYLNSHRSSPRSQGTVSRSLIYLTLPEVARLFRLAAMTWQRLT